MTGESLAGLVACVARFVLFGIAMFLIVACVAIPQNTDFLG